MKIIGSRIEQEYRHQLIESNRLLFTSPKYRRLLDLIKKVYAGMKTVYIIDDIPEQGENIYTILVNDDIIMKVEVDHDEAKEPIVIETKTVSQYLYRLKKSDQIQLTVALDLVKRDGERT